VGSQTISVEVTPATSGSIVVTAGDAAAAVDQSRVSVVVQ
jgi:hypothetical protein